MVWGAMSAHDATGLHFFQPGTTINGAKYLDQLKDKLEIHMIAMFSCAMALHALEQSQ